MNAVVLLRAVIDESATGGVYTGPWVLDGASQVAVGLARQWRQTAPGSRIVGIAIGPPEWEPALRGALMLECDEVMRGWSDAMSTADLLTVARAIASSVPAETAIVIGGESSSDHGTGVLPAAIAENLGWPYLGDVTTVVAEECGTTLTVRRDGGLRIRCRTASPVVVAAARMPPPGYYPRVARVIAARKVGIPWFDLGFFESAEQRLEVVGYGPAKPLTRHLLQPSAGANPAQRLRQLMSGGVASRGAQNMGGASDDTARRLADLLVSEGFVS